MCEAANLGSRASCSMTILWDENLGSTASREARIVYSAAQTQTLCAAQIKDNAFSQRLDKLASRWLGRRVVNAHWTSNAESGIH